MKNTNKQQATRTTEQATNTNVTVILGNGIRYYENPTTITQADICSNTEKTPCILLEHEKYILLYGEKIASIEHKQTLITNDNVITLSEIIAVKAMKTNLASGTGLTMDEYRKKIEKGENPNASGKFNPLYDLYLDLVWDIMRRKKDHTQPMGSGYDIVSEIKLYLLRNVGKKTTDENTDGEKNKDGTTADIWRTAFRVANRYIIGERKQMYKCVYVDEIDENGERIYYEIPQEWDVDTIHDYKTITAIIKQLKLTDTEKKILYYRLRGIAVDDTKKGKNGQPTQKTAVSVRTIAQKLRLSKSAVDKHLQNIRRKAVEIGLTPNAKTE